MVLPILRCRRKLTHTIVILFPWFRPLGYLFFCMDAAMPAMPVMYLRIDKPIIDRDPAAKECPINPRFPNIDTMVAGLHASI